MRITNYQLQFCFFFFAGADIHLCNCSSSAFQAGITGRFCPQVITCVMKVIAFQAKVSR
jgi:hypothetical protein